MMTEYVRGQTIHFSCAFKDADGADVSPDSPVLVIDFPVGLAGRDQATINMSGSGATRTAAWDSIAATRPGTVYWYAKASADSVTVAAEGSFSLTANPANLTVASA